MKIGRVATVIGIVVLLHVVGLVVLMRASRAPVAEGGASEVAPEVSSSSESASQPVAVSPEAVPSSAERGGVSADTGLSSRRYSAFAYDPGDMPRRLETIVNQRCRAGILVDLGSRRILWRHHSETPYPIASLTKIMTSYELLCQLKAPGSTKSLSTVVTVPKKMFRKITDTQIWMEPGETFTLDELLKCMMIRSANDCAYLVADYMGGDSEEAFVGQMNARARQLGYNSMVFYNSNGLTDKRNKRGNMSSALDIARLSERVWDVPEIMKWAGTYSDKIREDKTGKNVFKDLTSTNKLLRERKCPGVVGLKTGYTDIAKHCISLTCERKGRRLICVILGAEDKHARRDLAIRLLNWGFSVN